MERVVILNAFYSRSVFDCRNEGEEIFIEAVGGVGPTKN